MNIIQNKCSLYNEIDTKIVNFENHLMIDENIIDTAKKYVKKKKD